MIILNKILVVLVALEFLFIFYLQTIATSSPKTAKVFNLTKEDLKSKSFCTLLKNQGVYNFLIGVMLLIGLLIFHSKDIVLLLLGYIILVAVYGGISSNPKIFLKQGGIAIISFILIIIFGI